MELYKIENPTTSQIFDAIINNEYVPIEKIQHKARQIKVLLEDYYCGDVFVTFINVTNTGGFPVFFGQDSFYEAIQENVSDWYELTDEEKDEILELAAHYTREYDEVFDINP